jgi:hypothetical protein
MTVANTPRAAGPYLGNGSISVFAFSFKVFLTTDVLVQFTSAVGVLSTGTLGTDYAVSMNPDQNATPGGNIVLTVPLPSGVSLTVGSQVPLDQEVVLTNPGGFYPQVISDALDKVTILIQQALQSIAGAIRIPEIGSAQILPPAAARAGNLLSFDVNGNPITVAPAAQSATALTLALLSTVSALGGTGAVNHNDTLAYAAGTAGNKLKDWVSPTDYPWLADKTGATDPTAAINACYAWCKTNGKKMRILNGLYALGSTPGTFECPRDDGSYSPTIGAGETTLAPETAVNLPVSLIFDGSVEVEGESFDGTVLQGNWTYTSSAINTSQAVGILFGSTKDGYTTTRFRNLTLRNFFIPYIVQGALSRSDINIKVDGAAFAGLIQAAEGRSDFKIQMIRCYAGTIIGGWWLNRNRTTAATNMPSSFGGSYPASDIFRGCWGENIKFERIEWTAQPVFDSRADSVDTFFNTNFFKSANSAVYPAGRATVNADAAFTSSAGYPAYRGAFGFPIMIITRNGRYSNAMKVDEFVSSGHSRPGVYINAGGQIAVRQFYCENAGLVNPSGGTGSNTMGVARADPYHAGAPITLGLWLETEGGGGTYLEEFFGANNAPGVPFYDPARTYNLQIPQRGSAAQQFLGGAQLGPDGNPAFTYTSVAFTPGMNVGATAQAGLTVDRAVAYKVGGVTLFSLQLSKASLTISGTGAVTITGLPNAVNGGWVTITYFSMVTSTSLEVVGFLNGTTIELHKATNRGSPLTNADLMSGNPLVLTVSGGVFA